jgi:hypothetical protein
MAYIKNSKVTKLDLFNLREKYLSEFKDFKKEYSQFFLYYNQIHESFYGELEDINFICDIPNDCDIEIMYQKLKKISDALKGFHIFVNT